MEGIEQVYLFRGDLKYRRRALCAQIQTGPSSLMKILEARQDTALIIYRDQKSASIDIDLGSIRRAAMLGASLVQVRQLKSPLCYDTMGIYEKGDITFIDIYPAALEWAPERIGGPSVLKLKTATKESFHYILRMAQASCVSINWIDCFLDGGLQVLPALPITLRKLTIQNLAHPFPTPVAPVSSSGPAPDWIYELRHKLRYLQNLDLIGCRFSETDLSNFKAWIPDTRVTTRKRKTLATINELHDSLAKVWKPRVLAELVTRYTFLENPNRSSILLRSLDTAVRWYLKSPEIDSCIRLLPWAALAEIYQRKDLVKEVKDFYNGLSIPIIKRGLRRYLKYLIQKGANFVCMILAYISRATLDDILSELL